MCPITCITRLDIPLTLYILHLKITKVYLVNDFSDNAINVRTLHSAVHPGLVEPYLLFRQEIHRDMYFAYKKFDIQ